MKGFGQWVWALMARQASCLVELVWQACRCFCLMPSASNKSLFNAVRGVKPCQERIPARSHPATCSKQQRNAQFKHKSRISSRRESAASKICPRFCWASCTASHMRSNSCGMRRFAAQMCLKHCYVLAGWVSWLMPVLWAFWCPGCSFPVAGVRHRKSMDSW